MNSERTHLSIAITSDACKKVGSNMFIIIQQSYAQLKEELDSVFHNEEHVEIVVERRQNDRRKVFPPVTIDRRKVERRIKKDQLIEVIFSV